MKFIASVYEENTEAVYSQIKDLGEWIIENDPIRFPKLIDDDVVILSHGLPSSLVVSNYSSIQACQNDTVFRDKKAYLIACSTGLSLAPSAVKKGAKGILCYRDEFLFIFDSQKPHDQDPYLRMCIYPVRETIKAFVSTGDLRYALNVHHRASRDAEKSLGDDAVSEMARGFIEFNDQNIILPSEIMPISLPWWIAFFPALIVVFAETYYMVKTELEKLR